MRIRIKVDAVYDIPNGSEILESPDGGNPDIQVWGERLVVAGAMISRLAPGGKDANKITFVALGTCEDYAKLGISQPFLKVNITKERGDNIE